MTGEGRKVPWLPLAVAVVVVPAALTAFGFTVYGEELTGALPFSSAPATPSEVITHPAKLPVIQVPVPVVVPPSAPPAPPTPELVRQNVDSLFSSNNVKGITFAPGSAEFVGRGAEVQLGVGNLLQEATGSAITLVAHAWNGETLSHRCDVLAMERAMIVRDFLVGRGVPEDAIKTKVIVDPVWGPPSDGGPQVDVLVK
jgi:hypothetical protein